VSTRYRITHRTKYQYPDPVAICQNQLRMFPRSFGNVVCHAVDWQITPEPDSVERHFDYFGNDVFSFAIESVHRRLEVVVRSEVSVNTRPIPAADQAPTWEQLIEAILAGTDSQWLQVEEFLYDSPQVPRDQPFADYAGKSFPAGRSVLEAALDLTRRIHHDFRYDPEATHVNTPVHDVLRIKAGVCQDFAHLQLACLRSLGLPARYVSGYLRTEPPPGKPRLVGADQSHAWISVYAGDRIGWIDLDPTNARITDVNHVPVCIGRDYSEVSPMRGVVIGGGETQLSVSVDVEAID
jgi:transglutaminase-like putative cysteine protease